jgi:hypothetical protein
MNIFPTLFLITYLEVIIQNLSFVAVLRHREDYVIVRVCTKHVCAAAGGECISFFLWHGAAPFLFKSDARRVQSFKRPLLAPSCSPLARRRGCFARAHTARVEGCQLFYAICSLYCVSLSRARAMWGQREGAKEQHLTNRLCKCAAAADASRRI